MSKQQDMYPDAVLIKVEGFSHVDSKNPSALKLATRGANIVVKLACGRQSSVIELLG